MRIVFIEFSVNSGCTAMSSRTILDHFGVVDKYQRLYIVVGNYTPIPGPVAYLKYIPSKNRSIWCRHNTDLCFERVFRFYSSKIIENVVWERNQRTVYDPYLGSYVPIVPWYEVLEIIDPREVVSRLLKNCRDFLECLALEVIQAIHDNIAIEYSSIGITGSIMFGIHNIEVSDIDVVIYGVDNAKKFIEGVNTVELFEFVNESRFKDIVNNISKLHNVSPYLAQKIVTKFRRFVYKGKEVTIVFVDDNSWSFKNVVKSSRCADVVVRSNEYSYEFLLYPSKGYVFIEEIDGRPVKEYIEVLSFESVYSIPLFYGGRYRCRALVQVLDDDSMRIVLGARECRDSYMEIFDQ